ncbi:hypothetical protein HBI34_166650 [Parastagonospora nodorum]|nr:hypothetical protein HBI34_166650 [Parastagonospora nodorum]
MEHAVVACRIQFLIFNMAITLQISCHIFARSLPNFTSTRHRKNTLKTLPILATMTRYLTAALFLLISSSAAFPLRYEKSEDLSKRQAKPDQFGNTGSKPTSFPTIHSQPLPSVTSTVATPRISNLSTIWTSATTEASAVGSTISISSQHATSIAPQTPYNSSPTSSPTPSPSGSSPWLQLHGTKPPPLLSRASIAGITVGSAVFVALTIGLLLFLRYRRKAREIIEITTPHIKPSKPYGVHYNVKIARSRSWKLKQEEISGSSVSSWGSLGKNKLIHTYNSPISPSGYSRHAKYASAMMSGNFDGWPDARSQKVFTGTPSQLLNAPMPLFVDGTKKIEKDGAAGDVRRPKPVVLASVKPSDRPNGQVHGLGLR